jgi:serine/threonine-protein kinase
MELAPMTASHPPGPDVSTIGKYQLIANLGHGGMADVFLSVVHGPVGFNKLTVVKRLRPSLAEEPEFLAMFLDEARLAARLNHPNVVQTNEVGVADGMYFIAMEYLDGQPLNRILHRGAKHGDLPRGPLLRIVADALAGLHHAHELQDYDGTPISVVHRDASPHNIFITYEGQTKVVDFGIAKAATRSAETRGGVLKGKIAYMAPEQARSDEVDRRADIYAMGLVLWEVLTGSRLRRGSDLEMLDRIAAGEVPLLSKALPDCPPELEAIVKRSTALAKADRYATANEMRQDILAYLDKAHPRSTTEEVGQYVSRLFEGKRAEMRSIIERQLTGLRRASDGDSSLRVVDARRILADSAELPRASLGSNASLPGSSTPPAMRASSATQTPTQTPTQTMSTAVATETSSTLTSASTGSRLRAPLVLGAVAIGAAATVLFLRKGPDASSTPAASAAVTASASVTASSAAPEAAGTIEVHLSAKPDGAKLYLDDTALPSNPFVGKFRRDDKPHTVRAEADGHATAVRSVTFGSDQTLEIALEKAEAPKGKVPGAAPQPAAPDAVPKPTARPKKALDEDDPWKKPEQ